MTAERYVCPSCEAISSRRLHRCLTRGRVGGLEIPGESGEKKRGQALGEMSVVITLLLLLTLGAVEFSYAFLSLHIVTQATSAGARYASATHVGSRGTCGALSDANKADICNRVTAQTGNVVTVTSCTVTQNPTPATSTPCPVISQIPTVSVQSVGSIPYIFGLLNRLGPQGFTRTETFRDEGR
jgi:Flp pilus assembly protein TadG